MVSVSLLDFCAPAGAAAGALVACPPGAPGAVVGLGADAGALVGCAAPDGAPPPALPPHAANTRASVKTPANRANGVAIDLIGPRSPYLLNLRAPPPLRLLVRASPGAPASAAAPRS